MADEGHTNTNGAPGAPGAHPNSDLPPPKPIQNASRKSTLSKSGFDVNATSYGGASTPMGTKRESIDLEDYFVRHFLTVLKAKDAG